MLCCPACPVKNKEFRRTVADQPHGGFVVLFTIHNTVASVVFEVFTLNLGVSAKLFSLA